MKCHDRRQLKEERVCFGLWLHRERVFRVGKFMAWQQGRKLADRMVINAQEAKKETMKGRDAMNP